jgi:arabinogalactan endo-1,4-beta-galactosidase
MASRALPILATNTNNPAAWATLTFNELVTAVASHITQVLTALKLKEIARNGCR